MPMDLVYDRMMTNSTIVDVNNSSRRRHLNLLITAGFVIDRHRTSYHQENNNKILDGINFNKNISSKHSHHHPLPEL